MSVSRSVPALLLCLLGLLLPFNASAADQQLLGMLRLIPRSPGGLADQPLPLKLYAEGNFYFDLAISDDLAGTEYDDYIERRLNLLNAAYSVELRDHGRTTDYDSQRGGEFWASVPAVDGSYHIPASLLPDHVYSWAVIAQVDEGGGDIISLRSESLYFHTSSAGLLLSGRERLSQDSLAYANALALLGRLQHDENQAMLHSLRGVSNYVNYPQATNSYICTAIEPPGSRPLPSPAPDELLELPDLLELGGIMREARELHQWISSGREDMGQLRSLSNRCRLFVNRAQSRSDDAPEALGTLLEAARRLGVEEALSGPERLSLLSELLLLGDKLVAGGTVRLQGDSQASLSDYARSSERRLRQLSDMDPALYNLLGADRGRFWQEYFRSQRADLALLREELGLPDSGQSRSSALISQSAERARMQLPEAFDGMEGQRYAEAVAAFATLSPAGDPQKLRALLEAQLAWIAAAVWPRRD
ncbi:MAG: hypothetical protein H7A35_11840 [Planctomycetales bacterium]|nr:hypothetical protein [bacterium]UNM07549.1 MAG: hypothetical protein H7A35_11840 [Planctomycetales bacterium]